MNTYINWFKNYVIFNYLRHSIVRLFMFLSQFCWYSRHVNSRTQSLLIAYDKKRHFGGIKEVVETYSTNPTQHKPFL